MLRVFDCAGSTSDSPDASLGVLPSASLTASRTS
jgi:hypothetical protein